MLTYRTSNKIDLSLLVQMEKRCFSPCDWFSPKTFRRMIQNPKNSIILEIIEYNQETAGYALFLTRKNSSKIRLYSICILSEFRGKKIAGQYLEEKIADFKSSYHTITLEVRETNEKAIKLYHLLGFKTNKTLKNYYPDGENGLQMQKKIKSP